MGCLVATMKPGAPAQWSDTFARLTWRLMPVNAIGPLQQRAADRSLSETQRKLALDSLAFIDKPESAIALMDLAAEGSDLRDAALWWLKNRLEGEWSSFAYKPEMEKRGLLERVVPLTEITVLPLPKTTKFTVADVLAIKGDAARGKTAAARCIMCHKIDGAGPDYGPDLKGFASRQPPEVIAKALVDPSAEIAAGFGGTAIRLKDGKSIDGLVIADGDPLTIRSTGGVTQKVPRKQIAKRKVMDRSLMLNADQLGLSAGDVADIMAWMKTY